MKTATRKAFTLLEVVLAISLVLGVMGAAFRFYQYVADTRDAIGRDMRFQRTVRGAMDRLTKELECTIGRPLMEERVLWLADSIAFNTTALPGASAWADVGLADEPVPPVHDVILVSYAIRTSEDDTGGTVVDGLERTRFTAPPLATDDAPAFETSVLVTDAIKFIRFRYWAGDEVGGITDEGWVDEWTATSAPPAVEITLGREPLTDGMDVEEYLDRYETFRRVVYIPAGSSGAGTEE